MSDVSQGPEWWQAADLKWYPPELHADYVAPLSPPPPLPPPPKLPPPPTPPPAVTPNQPPATTKDPSGQSKVGIVLVGLTLLAIAVMAVAVLIGAKASGLFAVVVAWAIVIIGVTIVVRSDLPRARKVVFSIAFFLAVQAGGWLIGATVAHPFQKGPSPSSPSSPSAQSPYYQEGYNSGTSGLARKGYGDNMYNTGATVAEMEHQACADAINNESNLASIEDSDHPANQDDYMKGCLDAFHDHPPSAKPKPGPLNPYR